jgi:hypothetical protein
MMSAARLQVLTLGAAIAPGIAEAHTKYAIAIPDASRLLKPVRRCGRIGILTTCQLNYGLRAGEEQRSATSPRDELHFGGRLALVLFKAERDISVSGIQGRTGGLAGVCTRWPNLCEKKIEQRKREKGERDNPVSR